MTTRPARAVAYGLASLLGLGAASVAVSVAVSWLRYGSAAPSAPEDADAILDRFMPEYEIVERHHVNVAAPAGITFGALMDLDLEDSHVIRAIFRGRELLLGADPGPNQRARGLHAATKALGWGVLAEAPGHEIVMGAVTQPWNANVVFRSLSPDEFAAFNEADHVKIVWTLRADAVSDTTSIARTETRAIATDAQSRRKFRWYWARFSPGIVLIREISLRLVRKEAERRALMQDESSEHHTGSGRSTETVVPPSGRTSM
jgi:hypothetical protein